MIELIYPLQSIFGNLLLGMALPSLDCRTHIWLNQSRTPQAWRSRLSLTGSAECATSVF